MTKEVMLKNTLTAISRLPKNKLSEVAQFVELVARSEEEVNLQKGIEKLSLEGGALDFLNEEEDLYSLADLKVKYHK